ncbi:5-carboxymethyl-2-hydroxymuconate Delta-isomerase [Hasllibacter sp. MH4015]|uniref:5-carboxymethyl-2-hydroxymuconate Delta-isomerase n=1 Tax=Hasllibacter sp. MH4015 TaxID=2854029 RepID=UPI001CD41345
MPHFQIDYSANLEEVVDMGALCETIRNAAASVETFPTPGIRVRAVRVDHYAIADGNPKHGFIDLSIRLREGRPADVKRDAVTRIFAALTEFVAPVMADHSIALSAEMRDIDAALSPKAGTIRNHMEGPT